MSVLANTQYAAVLLLGFGGPTAPEEIRPFIDRALDGRHIPSARYEEVVAHYIQIGGKSPYNELTQQQANALAQVLHHRGIDIPVEVAYRNAAPFLGDVMKRLTEEGARRVFGIVLAPHQSGVSWDKYVHLTENARRDAGSDAPFVNYIDPYFDHPLFIRAHADRINDAWARFGRTNLDGIRLIFTAHSIPVAMPGADVYVWQLRRSAELIASAASAKHWGIAYQSRSGSVRIFAIRCVMHPPRGCASRSSPRSASFATM